MLWGLYHGLLLLATQAVGRWKIFERPFGRWLLIPQIAGMFVLTNIGWLLFRETELAAIVRDLTLSPFGVSELDRQTGLVSVPAGVRVLSAAVDPEPLGRDRGQTAAAAEEEPVTLPPMSRLVLQGVACGLALAAILVLRSRTSLDFIYFQF